MKIQKKFKDEERRMDPKRKQKKLHKKRTLNPNDHQTKKYRINNIDEV